MCSILNLFHLIEVVGEAIMEGVCSYLFFAWSLFKEGWLLFLVCSYSCNNQLEITLVQFMAYNFHPLFMVQTECEHFKCKAVST